MTFSTPAEKSAALASATARLAENAAALEAEPATAERAVKAACLLACAEAERAKIMAVPCRPLRPSLHNGGRVSLVQVLRRDS